jgi:molybdopterin/thiamine biosynthesis adenylyltransferase
VRVFSAQRQPGTRRLGYWLRSTNPLEISKASLVGNLHLRPGQILIVLQSKTGEFECFRMQPDGHLAPQPYELIQLYADYHSRLEGLFDPSLLPEKKVVIVGLGTGGSTIAAELARAGVGNFTLVDFDRLKVANLSRHICGLSDLGRLKTHAVRDYLYNTSMVARVETFEFDVTSDAARLEQILAGADLLIGATDSEDAKALLNRTAWKLGIPGVYGAAYDLGFGGDVFLAEPPDGACYECFRRATSEMFKPPQDVEIEYGKTVAQPALGLDVRFIGLIAARMALTWLLRTDPSSRLEPYPANWVLWGNWPQPGWLFEKPLQSEFVQIEPDPICPVCHYEAYSQATVGLSPDEAQAQAAALLEHLPSL